MHSQNDVSEVDKYLGDCNKLLDGNTHTAEAYSTAQSEGFVLRFVLPRPVSVEAIETCDVNAIGWHCLETNGGRFVKKSSGTQPSGYAAPRISVRTANSNIWHVVYSSKDLWGQFTTAEPAMTSLIKKAPAFRRVVSQCIPCLL